IFYCPAFEIMLTAAIVTLVLACAAGALQWTQTNPTPTAAEMQAVACDGEGTYVVAGWEFAVNITASLLVARNNDLAHFTQAHPERGDITAGVAWDGSQFLVLYENTAAAYSTIGYLSKD